MGSLHMEICDSELKIPDNVQDYYSCCADYEEEQIVAFTLTSLALCKPWCKHEHAPNSIT